jgi:hypothetical protein
LIIEADVFFWNLTLEQAQEKTFVDQTKLCKDVVNIITGLSCALREVANGGGGDGHFASSAAARPASASAESDMARPNLSFELPPTLDVSNGSIEWHLPPGVSRVGNAMKNAEYVRTWKKIIDNVLSKVDIPASSKVSEEGPEELVTYWEGESNYWAGHLTLLKTPPFRAVLISCRADRSLNRQWKNTMSSLSQRFASAHDCTQFLKLLSPLFFKFHKQCQLDVASEILSQIVNAAHASYSLCRYGETTQILTSFFARISNRLMEICKFHLQSGRLWKMLLQDASDTNIKLCCCINLLEEYPRIFKLAQDESVAAYIDQSPPSVDRSVVFARTKIFLERLKKLLDITDAQVQFDVAISTGIDGLPAAVEPFREQFKLFTFKVTDPLNLSGETNL